MPPFFAVNFPQASAASAKVFPLLDNHMNLICTTKTMFFEPKSPDLFKNKQRKKTYYFDLPPTQDASGKWRFSLGSGSPNKM